MAFADYFERGAVAAAQVIAGFDEQAFKQALSDRTVGLSLGAEAAEAAEGRCLADLIVRLLARLYPSLAIGAVAEARGLASELGELACRINPAIEIREGGSAKAGIVIGAGKASFDTSVFVGSDRWLALVGTDGPRPIGDSPNPFGAGAAACLACANIFRLLFLAGADQLDTDIIYSTYLGDVAVRRADQPSLPRDLPSGAVLIGCGAIGNGAAWALARAPFSGDLHLVDPEAIELSNLQRYVLGERSDVDLAKVDIAQGVFDNGITPIPHQDSWARFVDAAGYNWRHALVALDSAVDRRAVQASLPERIVNAWTQPGDLGVSLHGRFPSVGSCLFCLYLPAIESKNEDELVAEALGVPDRQQQVRHLLYKGVPVPPDLLDAVAERLNVPRGSLAAFEDRSVRELYVEGLCGGAVLPLDRLHAPRQEVHVPLAHQSALAGIQLAASFIRQLHGGVIDTTEITRINLLRSLGADLRQPARKGDQRCICADADYVRRYTQKWGDDQAKGSVGGWQSGVSNGA